MPTGVARNISRSLYTYTSRGVVLLASKRGIFRMERNFADTGGEDDDIVSVLNMYDETVYCLTSDAHTNRVYFYEDKSNVRKL